MPFPSIAQVFNERPGLAARWFFMLGMRMASRIQKMNEQDPASLRVERRLDDFANAPQTMEAIAANPAFLLIMHKFVLPGS